MLPQVCVEQSFIRNTSIGCRPWLYVRCDLEKATLKMLSLKGYSSPVSTSRGGCYEQKRPNLPRGPPKKLPLGSKMDI